MSDELNIGQEGEPQPTAEGQAPEAPSTDFHTIKWNGQEKQLPYQELVNLAQQGFDYTQKLQKFGSKEREYQGRLTQYEQALQEVKSFLTDKARLQAYMAEAFKEAQEQQADEPNDLITAQQMQQQLQQMNARQKQEFMQQLHQMRTEMEVTQLAGDYSAQINATIQGILNATPHLKAIPRIERILKDEVRERNPESIDQAKALLREVAADFSRKQQEFLTSQQKQSASQAQGLSRGIEPPGGQAPSAPPQPAFKSVSDPRLRELVMADLMKAVK